MTLCALWGSKRTQAHMGTLISVNVADENISDELFTLFADLDNRLSTYKGDSEISRLNRRLELNVSEMTRVVLERSMEMYRISDGAFDITIGSFTHDVYRFGYENEHLPSQRELQRAEHYVGSKRIKIDKNSVKILPRTVIDLGGIGKGYAVDLAINILNSKGIKNAIVAASGDIGCLGSCEVQIQDPFHPDAYVGTIVSTLPRIAVSTSGNYERYIKNKSHNHLIDPKTGKSQQRYASITLIDKGDNTRIDALATAVSVMEEEKAIALLQSLNLSYLLIRNDGTVRKNIILKGIEITYTADISSK